MDRNEAAYTLARDVSHLINAMREKGYPKAEVRFEVRECDRFCVYLQTGGPKAFPALGSLDAYEFCHGRSAQEAFAKAVEAVEKMEDTHAYDPWFEVAPAAAQAAE